MGLVHVCSLSIVLGHEGRNGDRLIALCQPAGRDAHGFTIT